MKDFHPTKQSLFPWLVISIDDKGLEVIHAQLGKRKEVDNVLRAYQRIYPNRNLQVVYRPKI